MRALLGIGAGLLAAACMTAHADDWPQWWGPNRDGVSRETGWLDTWPADGPPIGWAKQIGTGYAAVSVVGERLYTMGNDGANDVVWCLDAASGAEIWRHTYPCTGGGGGWPGTRTAPTVDDGRLYTLSLKGFLLCLDADTGDVIWQVDTPSELGAKGGRHGFSCHPLVVGDRVIVELGARQGNVVAFDKRTGDVLWQSGGNPCGHSSPVLWERDGRQEVLLLAGDGLVAVRPEDGGQLWAFPCRIDYNCPIAPPIVSGDRVFISSSYYKHGASLLEVSGENPSAVWHTEELKSHSNGAILWQGHLYGFDGMVDTSGGKGVLKCMEMATGRVRWTQTGLGTGSVLVADGRLVVLGKGGDLLVAPATPEGFRPTARAKVLSGRCWTMPVLAGSLLYCRSFEGRLVCLDLRPTPC